MSRLAELNKSAAWPTSHQMSATSALGAIVSSQSRRGTRRWGGKAGGQRSRGPQMAVSLKLGRTAVIRGGCGGRATSAHQSSSFEVRITGRCEVMGAGGRLSSALTDGCSPRCLASAQSALSKYLVSWKCEGRRGCGGRGLKASSFMKARRAAGEQCVRGSCVRLWARVRAAAQSIAVSSPPLRTFGSSGCLRLRPPRASLARSNASCSRSMSSALARAWRAAA